MGNLFLKNYSIPSKEEATILIACKSQMHEGQSVQERLCYISGTYERKVVMAPNLEEHTKNLYQIRLITAIAKRRLQIQLAMLGYSLAQA